MADKKRKPMSEETKRKIGEKKKGKPFSGISWSWKGKKMRCETKKKMSLASLGKKKSLQHRLNISKGKRGKAMVWGTRCWNWKGGISKIDKLCRGMREYSEWRSDVFTRDNWTCQTCGITGVYVTGHHKKGFMAILKENNIKTVNQARKCQQLWDRNNGVTLCEECHKLTDNYKGRAINN